MARNGRFASFLLYVAGIALVGGAALAGLLMWHDNGTALSASREALAEVVQRVGGRRVLRRGVGRK